MSCSLQVFKKWGIRHVQMILSYIVFSHMHRLFEIFLYQLFFQNKTKVDLLAASIIIYLSHETSSNVLHLV